MTHSSGQAMLWQQAFATGVAVIDDQHKILVNMLNDASEKLSDGSPAGDFERIVQGLLNYSVYHFQTEERLMAEFGYDKECADHTARHVKAHRGFTDKMTAVKAEIQAGICPPKAELEKFLVDWLADHILHTDKKLGAFIRDKLMKAARS